jgi:hypothetical protein
MRRLADGWPFSGDTEEPSAYATTALDASSRLVLRDDHLREERAARLRLSVGAAPN